MSRSKKPLSVKIDYVTIVFEQVKAWDVIIQGLSFHNKREIIESRCRTFQSKFNPWGFFKLTFTLEDGGVEVSLEIKSN